MNKSLLKIIMTSLLIASFHFTLLAQSPKAVAKMLLGKWKPDMETLKKKMDEEIQKKLENAQTEEEKEQIEQSKSMMPMLISMMEGMQLEFLKGGVMKIGFKNPFSSQDENKTGSWELSKDGKTIITQEGKTEGVEDGKQTNMSIVAITAAKLTVENVEEKAKGGDNPMTTMTFLKQK
jgi:hypothetical protein